MVDVASIVVAIISLLTSVVVAGVTSWLTYSTDKRKSRREAERLLAKYRDPLLFAAEDLQSRLWGILEEKVLEFHGKSARHEDALFIYTAFVLGQYLAWTNILRRETQLMPFSIEDEPDKRLRDFIETLYNIRTVLLTDIYDGEEGTSFTLWRGDQMAIGEFMASVDKDGGDAQLLCMGFFEFTQKWKGENAVGKEASRSLQSWFQTVTDGINVLIKEGPKAKASYRLRRLQHLLNDLIKVLDPEVRRLHSKGMRRCAPAPACPCTTCSATRISESRAKRSEDAV